MNKKRIFLLIISSLFDISSIRLRFYFYCSFILTICSFIIHLSVVLFTIFVVSFFSYCSFIFELCSFTSYISVVSYGNICNFISALCSFTFYQNTVILPVKRCSFTVVSYIADNLDKCQYLCTFAIVS